MVNITVSLKEKEKREKDRYKITIDGKEIESEHRIFQFNHKGDLKEAIKCLDLDEVEELHITTNNIKHTTI